jgi:F-type H+-transporting ATPase subunit b
MTHPLEALLQRPLDAVETTAAMAGGGSLVDLDITVVINLAFFLAAWFLLKMFLFDPYLKVREAREKGVGGSREEAEALKAKAQAALSSYEAQMAEARQSAAELRAKLKAEGEAQERATTQAARAEASAKLGQHRAQVELQVAEAKAQLRTEAKALSELISNRLMPSA